MVKAENTWYLSTDTIEYERLITLCEIEKTRAVDYAKAYAQYQTLLRTGEYNHNYAMKIAFDATVVEINQAADGAIAAVDAQWRKNWGKADDVYGDAIYAAMNVRSNADDVADDAYYQKQMTASDALETVDGVTAAVFDLQWDAIQATQQTTLQTLYGDYLDMFFEAMTISTVTNSLVTATNNSPWIQAMQWIWNTVNTAWETLRDDYLENPEMPLDDDNPRDLLFALLGEDENLLDDLTLSALSNANPFIAYQAAKLAADAEYAYETAVLGREYEAVENGLYESSMSSWQLWDMLSWAMDTAENIYTQVNATATVLFEQAMAVANTIFKVGSASGNSATPPKLPGTAPRFISAAGSGRDVLQSADAIVSLGNYWRGKIIAGRQTGGLNCFEAGTLVLMADGTWKAIEQIRVGDMVMSVDENDPTQTPVAKRVTETFKKEVGRILELTINGETIRTTEDHPFYVEGKGWVMAMALRPGDVFRTESGEFVTVDAIRLTTDFTRVYNFEVEENHTYFVRTGEESVLVHNANVIFNEDHFWSELKILNESLWKYCHNELKLKGKVFVGESNWYRLGSTGAWLQNDIYRGWHIHVPAGVTGGRAAKLFNDWVNNSGGPLLKSAPILRDYFVWCAQQKNKEFNYQEVQLTALKQVAHTIEAMAKWGEFAMSIVNPGFNFVVTIDAVYDQIRDKNYVGAAVQSLAAFPGAGIVVTKIVVKGVKTLKIPAGVLRTITEAVSKRISQGINIFEKTMAKNKLYHSWDAVVYQAPMKTMALPKGQPGTFLFYQLGTIFEKSVAKENIKQMVKGNAPSVHVNPAKWAKGPLQKVEIHHINQDALGPFLEMPGDLHRKMTHNLEPKGITKIQWNAFRKTYWQERAKEAARSGEISMADYQAALDVALQEYQKNNKTGISKQVYDYLMDFSR